MLQNIFSLIYQLVECWSSFAISWCRWNWSHDKVYIRGLADLLCHITKNHNPNCKPVSGFQNLLKKRRSLHKKFSHKRSRLYQPSQQCWEPKRRPLAQQEFPLGQVHRTNGTGFYLLFSNVSKLLWSDVWFRLLCVRFRFTKFLPSVLQPTAHLSWIRVM